MSCWSDIRRELMEIRAVTRLCGPARFDARTRMLTRVRCRVSLGSCVSTRVSVCASLLTASVERVPRSARQATSVCVKLAIRAAAGFASLRALAHTRVRVVRVAPARRSAVLAHNRGPKFTHSVTSFQSKLLHTSAQWLSVTTGFSLLFSLTRARRANS